MPTDSLPATKLESQVLSLIGDHIMELSAGFAVNGNLFEVGLDSMAIMQLLLVVEEHLGVAIPVGEVTKENFRSARSIARLVREKRGDTSEEEAPQESTLDGQILPLTEAAAKPLAEQPEPFAYRQGPIITPLTESDCFVRSNERLMIQTGQGLHLVSSVLDLESAPDIDRLRAAMRRLIERHPMLTAEFAQRFFGLPSYKRGARPAASVPMGCWYEEGAAGESRAWEAQPIPSAREKLETLLTLTEAEMNADGTCHVRCDLIEKRQGGFLFILTWRHIIFDGVGAEHFCCEIDHAAADKPGHVLPPLETPSKATPEPMSVRLKRATPIKDFLNEISGKRVRSLAGPKPAKGKLRFELLELNAEQSRRVFARGQQFCGPVMTVPFHVACSIRAHELVWRYRQQRDMHYMVTVPVQVRRKGARGPIFQNRLTMLFLTATSEEAQSIEAMVGTLQKQQERFLKEKLGESFQEMQKLMGHMPPWLYTLFIRLHMRGEMTSFFFSGTGTFAPELTHFAGALVRNAYHVPSINRPPGTGLFVNDKNGLVTLVLSYREGVLDENERILLRDGFAESLIGEWPNPETLPVRALVDRP